MEEGKEKYTVTKAVVEVIDEMEVGFQFGGKELQRLVVKKIPWAKDKYPDTFLRLARLKRRDSFKCVSRSRSLYEKIEHSLGE